MLDGAKKVGSGIGKGLVYAGRVAYPMLSIGTAANDFVSGQRSFGEAAGEAAGDLAGFAIGDKLWNKHMPKFLKGPGMLRGAGRFAGSIVIPGITSAIAGTAGSELLGKVIPFRRSPVKAQQYFNNNGANFSNVQQ